MTPALPGHGVRAAAPAAAELVCSPPSMSDGRNQHAPPGLLVSAAIDFIFKSNGENSMDLGTNPRFVSAQFQSKYYYDAGRSGLSGGILEATAKTVEDLQAIGEHTPPKPFYITVRLKVTNDGVFSTEGAVTYETSW